MTSEIDLKSQYFQRIARFLLEKRKAPLFLSPEEIDLIDRWQKRGIPLRVVLEGLKTAYELFKQKGSGSRRSFNLKYARNFVYRAFASHRDRRVGRKRERETEASQQVVIRAVEEFLDRCPAELEEVKPLFNKGLVFLAEEGGEDMLEDLDEEVDAILLKKASPEERAEAETEVREKYYSELVNEKELSRLLSLSLKKNIREKHRIPYLSLYLH